MVQVALCSVYLGYIFSVLFMGLSRALLEKEGALGTVGTDTGSLRGVSSWAKGSQSDFWVLIHSVDLPLGSEGSPGLCLAAPTQALPLSET